MDILSLCSEFSRGIAMKIMQNLIKKKLGFDVYVDLNSLKVSIDESNAHIKLDCNFSTKKENLQHLLRQMGDGKDEVKEAYLKGKIDGTNETLRSIYKDYSEVIKKGGE